MWSLQTGSLLEPSQARTQTQGASGSTSQFPFWRTPPHGPFRRFFGHRMGQDIPVECRMHCPHIRQSQMRSFVSRSTRRRTLRKPRTGRAVVGGLRSSLVAMPTRSFRAGGPYFRELAGTSFFASTNGIAAVVPTRWPPSDSTSRRFPGSDSSTGTQT